MKLIQSAASKSGDLGKTRPNDYSISCFNSWCDSHARVICQDRVIPITDTPSASSGTLARPGSNEDIDGSGLKNIAAPSATRRLGSTAVAATRSCTCLLYTSP